MKKSKLVALFISAAFAIVLAGCSSPTVTPAQTYTVTYVDGVDDAEIAVPTDSASYHAGDTVTVKFDGIGNRNYYEFTGWSDGSTTYTSNGTTSFTMGSANVTLTATWNGPFIGTKAPSVAKAVGDIVFNDGSAMPYSVYNTELTDAEKEAKKNSAIALIFYKGTGLNSDAADGTPDNTTSRTLGVGLKHYMKPNGFCLAWCRKTSDTDKADAFSVNITSIQCPASGTAGALTFTGDKNGSDNLEQIAAFDGISDTGGGDSTTSAEQAALNYPAFYFAKNYKNVEGSRVAGTDYESGWYLPSIAELFQIYANGKGSNKIFDIDAASESLRGDKFENSYYWSSSQYPPVNNPSYASLNNAYAYALNFNSKSWYGSLKDDTSSNNVCCIHEFN